MTMIEPGGRRSVLQPSTLPAPMHGLPAILRSHCFSIADKISLCTAFAAILLGPRPKPTESLAQWLGRHHQSRGALDRFWRLVIASALNADLDQISLSAAIKVIRQIFLNSPHAGDMGMSTLPLSELYGSAQSYLEARGSTIQYQSNVDSADWDQEQHQWTIQSREHSHTSDFLVLALPFEATARLIPNLPANPAAAQLATSMQSLEHWPICSVHLWFDRQITELDHAVLLDCDIHWMYHKSRWQPQRDPGASYIELVISASREFATLTREQALSRSLEQLAQFFPAVKEAKVIKSAFIKEVRATCNVPPGSAFDRSTADSPWPNCFLAGDWTGTGWASTMESATRSGYRAAEAIARQTGAPAKFLVPDLQPTGLMRVLSKRE
jgi:zeta-carotene desaturase